MNIIEALDDPNLLGASIRDAESWRPWRALLAAVFGLPLENPYQAELFRQCTGRRVPPSAPAAYLWLCIGRRGGKSFAMALIAVFLAVFRDWRKYLSPGERAIVLLVAADRTGENFTSILSGHIERADSAKLGLECHGERD
jgi:hypothetical protein